MEIKCVKFIGSSLNGKGTNVIEDNMGILTLVSIVEFDSCKTCKGADRRLVFASLYSGSSSYSSSSLYSVFETASKVFRIDRIFASKILTILVNKNLVALFSPSWGFGVLGFWGFGVLGF